MNRRAAVLAMLALPLGARARGTADLAGQEQEPWTPLFNGRDLTSWETFLGKPHKLIEVPGQLRNAQGEYPNIIGLDNDPKGVFSVVTVDGRPAIRISGEIYGALTTREEYENYHLRFEFKWGEARWPPREQAIRDSGCCYHCVGPHGASYGFWMRSCEFQIQEGDCGDFYSLAGVIVDAEAVRKDPADPGSELIFTHGAPRIVGHTKRIIKDADYERPRGEWNTMDLYCLGQTSAHSVNGKVNMTLTGLRHMVDGREAPLTRGRIQLQSEAAEVFYRNIAVRRIREIPKAIPG
jgi:3-keto-disaccharide hydrolase